MSFRFRTISSMPVPENTSITDWGASAVSISTVRSSSFPSRSRRRRLSRVPAVPSAEDPTESALEAPAPSLSFSPMAGMGIAPCPAGPPAVADDDDVVVDPDAVEAAAAPPRPRGATGSKASSRRSSAFSRARGRTRSRSSSRSIWTAVSARSRTIESTSRPT